MSGGQAAVGTAEAYQRQRLLAGVAGIGLVMVSLWIALAAGAGSLLDRVAVGPAPVAGGVAAGALALVASVLLAPLDHLAGVRIERNSPYGAPARSRELVAGVTLWVAAVALGGVVTGAAALVGDWWWLLLAGAFAVLTALGTLGATRAAAFGAGAHAATERDELDLQLAPLGLRAPPLVFAPPDASRVLDGGWSGRVLVLSASCRSLVGSPQLACLVARELGHRARHDQLTGIVVGAVWLAAVPPPAAALLGPSPERTGELVLAVAATATTWQWIGLLVLPSLGRRQVIAADRFWLERGGAPRVLRDTILLLAERNGASFSRSPWIDRVFHPVPSPARRLAIVDSCEGDR